MANGLIYRQSNIHLSAVSDEPDMSTVGTLFWSADATTWATYANITAMGNDGGASLHIVPVPSPVTTSSGLNTSETILVTGGRLVTGKLPHMIWPGSDQESATFETFPENAGNSIADNSTHYFQMYARMSITGGWNGESLNVKFWEFWWRHKNDRTQTNTRYPIGGNPDTATTVFELLDGTEVNMDSQQPVGPYPEQLWDGNWHRFTVSIKTHSGTNGANKDGFQRLWIDGTKVIDCSQATVGVIPSGGVKAWCTQSEVDRLTDNDTVSKMMWGSVQTNNPDGSQDTNPWTMEIDNLIWRYA